MKEINYKNSDGNNVNISLLGSFKIEDLNKEYIMYSVVDDDKNNMYGHVLLGEIERNGNDVQILGIKEEEQDVVLAFYNEILNQIGGE